MRVGAIRERERECVNGRATASGEFMRNGRAGPEEGSGLERGGQWRGSLRSAEPQRRLRGGASGAPDELRLRWRVGNAGSVLRARERLAFSGNCPLKDTLADGVEACVGDAWGLRVDISDGEQAWRR